MRSEEIDWVVYQILAKGDVKTVNGVVNQTQLSPEDIEASLTRLSKACLIDRSDQSVRILSWNEIVIKNQLTHTEECPFSLENGVIKVKKGRGN